MPKPDEPSLDEKRQTLEYLEYFGTSDEGIKRAASFLKLSPATLKRWLKDVEEADARAARPLLITGRLLPPGAILDPMDTRPLFAPDAELAEWVRETFLREDGKLANPDHAHLRWAHLGFLWTNVGNTSKMQTIVGTCEIPKVQGGKWIKARADMQMEAWFGRIPHFVITLFAPYAEQCSDATFCALIEHELYHAAQAKDIWGAPRFTRDGDPVYAIKGHDVEEHVGVVRRYGVGSAAGETAALVEAANAEPEIAEADILWACGTCLR